MKLKILSLFAVDDLTDRITIEKQIYEIKASGFDGIVFHPRRYSGEPVYLGDEYMALVSEIILFAKRIGLQFWIYDENGWPSGSADGQTIKSVPDLKCKWLEYRNGRVEIKECRGINSLDPRGVAKFIELTYDAYENELMPEAFQWISGFFSDEVGFLEGHGAVSEGGIPWFDGIDELYENEFGQDIYIKLPLLFSEKPDSFKVWYWERLTDRLASVFYGMIEAWCKKRGKLFTAHLKGEESPFFSIGYSGSCFGVLKRISVPGIDALERYAGNVYYLRIASSLSKQFGSGIAMAEAMGGAGWGITPADVHTFADKLIDCGTNLIIFHINQLHLTYDGITDWPASIPCHMPWRDAFTQLTEHMRHRAEKKKTADVLLIIPVRGTIKSYSPALANGMNEHDGSHQMLSQASIISKNAVIAAERLYETGICFDLTDERVFEDNAVISDGKLRLGRCEYKKVVIADGCEFSTLGADLISQCGARPYREIILKGQQTEWDFTAPDSNNYFVEINKGEGEIATEFICTGMLTVSEICNVFFNGKLLECEYKDDHGAHYHIDALNKGRNKLKLSVDKAFVYFSGEFSVFNREPFYEYDERHIETRNGFYIAEPHKPGNDFILSGYPFAFEPIIAEKEFTSGGGIRIDCSHIASAHVFIDGEDYGWIYNGNETVSIQNSERSIRKVRLYIYQSAYNIYGPHYHCEGDRYVVSPAQYSGERNFADTPTLPANTSSEYMKLVKWSIREYIEII